MRPCHPSRPTPPLPVPRLLRTLPVLAAAALAPPVAAGDLAIDTLQILAQASLRLTVPNTLPMATGPTLLLVDSAATQANPDALKPPVVVTGTTDDPWRLSFAAANMANTGFFREQVSVINAYPPEATRSASQLPLTVGAGADTAHVLTVHATTPDAPLSLGLTVFGAHLAGSDYYGAGRLHLRLDLDLSVSLDNAPATSPWSYSLDLSLNDHPGDGWVLSRGGIDLQGVGHPAERFVRNPSGFATTAALDVDFFHADLDFGLLQPGHSFSVSYRSAVSVNGELTYAGPQSFAQIDLTDPLSLGGDTSRPPIALAGVTLPPVPEPPAAWLLLGGVAALAAARSVRLAQAGDQRLPLGRQR